MFRGHSQYAILLLVLKVEKIISTASLPHKPVRVSKFHIVLTRELISILHQIMNYGIPYCSRMHMLGYPKWRD